MRKGFPNHPYIPNSVPEVEKEMLDFLGMESLDDLHKNVPDELMFKGEMDIPEAFGSEYEMRRYVEELLDRDGDGKKYLNFLGAGCWQHYVPAICDEVNSRGEFLTAYGGEPYNELGRFQTQFEYQSLVAELVGMDVVNVPAIDWAQAAATTCAMAQRKTGRKQIVLPEILDPEKRAVIENFGRATTEFVTVACAEDGQIDLEDLKKKIGKDTAGVYFENPNYLGVIETRGEEISRIAHEAGAESLVGVDPITLGVMAPPPEYGADIVCGELQPLGIHMNYGGGLAGFMATRDEEDYVNEYPSRLFGIAPTTHPGEYGFGDVAYDRTSFGNLRDGAKEYVGTQAALWGLTAGVYLATMGPAGMEEVGQTCMQNARYAVQKLNEINGIKANSLGGHYFKEFVVDFSATGKTVAEIHKILLSEGIFGGKDISGEFPRLGQSALYCVTEIHTQRDIDRLVNVLARVLA
ncbi:MAG: aminomethyl-transferring glycine dehydrogenase subunit GcvPA [Anaerovoracaceae bacterium]|jgi:glycine dehydrogenase subunit 1